MRLHPLLPSSIEYASRYPKNARAARLSKLRYLIALSVLFACFATPNILLLSIDFDRQHIVWLLSSVAIFALWVGAFATLRQAVGWALPFFCLLPPIALFIWDYQEFPTANVVGILHDTTLEEAQVFAVGRAGPALLILGLCLSIWTLVLISARGRPVWPHTKPLHLAGRWRLAARHGSRGVLLALISAAALATTPWLSGIDAVQAKGEITNAHDLVTLPFQLTRLANVFPVGPIVSAIDFTVGERNRREWQRIKAGRIFGATKLAGSSRRVYVLVIGESSRSDRWQLGGYSRETNPLLGQEPGVTFLSDVVSPWTFTLASVPVITSRKSGADRSRFFAEKSILSLFKEAGFRTYWISNQARPAGIGTEIADINSEADVAEGLNMSARDYARETTYDIALTARLRAALARDEPRQFIVLHLMGSHDAYRARYPASFDKFRPSLTSAPEANDHDIANREMIGNTYDNSIVYTDYVLHSVIDALKASGAEAGLFYTSDHGESLYDGACDFIGHGGTARENYMVSALVWLSKIYIGRNPDAAANLAHNAQRRLSTENVFESLAGMAGIAYPDARPARNVFSRRFEEADRNVNVGNRSVNWDRARFDGACHRPVPHEPDPSRQAEWTSGH